MTTETAPSCVCHPSTALRCSQLRYPILDCIGEEDPSAQNDVEPCQCSCHYAEDPFYEDDWHEDADMGAR